MATRTSGFVSAEEASRVYRDRLRELAQDQERDQTLRKHIVDTLADAGGSVEMELLRDKLGTNFFALTDVLRELEHEGFVAIAGHENTVKLVNSQLCSV